MAYIVMMAALGVATGVIVPVLLLAPRKPTEVAEVAEAL